MSATGKYIFCKYPECENGLGFIFYIDQKYLLDLFIPNIKSISELNKFIAIEKHKTVYKSETKSDFNEIFKSRSQISSILDSGRINARCISDNKFELSLISEILNRENLNLVMIVPSWGRWTAHKVWLIIMKK